MDYIDGASLQQIVGRFGPLPVVRACHYVRHTATGLQHAHEAGLLHRDVKPANIMLERTGGVRLLDLGLARFYLDNTDLLTIQFDDRNVLGTADYVSPEQALNSHEVDLRTDVYSLGATFYFCLTGLPPFPEGKIAQKLIWHQVRQPMPVRQLRPDIPESVAAIVEKMMAKNPAHRYQTANEVIEALKPWTNEPISPPREEEMPRLSPAASSAQPRENNAGSVRRDAPGSRPARSAASPARRQPSSEVSGRVATLDRVSSSGEETAPRISASAPTPTAQPRAGGPVSPSQLLKRPGKQLAAVRKGPGGRSSAWLVLLAVLCAVGGAVLMWFVRR
jgi:serine/threonine protein kinase